MANKLEGRKAMERGNTMNLEKEIPDYAMIPAKEAEARTFEPITADAIYSPVEITNITPCDKLIITLEEDILVPDIKPDLKEILIMEGSCNLTTKEISILDTHEDHFSISGKVHIQTIYLPENPDKQCPLVSVSTTIPFKEPWSIDSATYVTFDCTVDKVEYSIINERKYRAKITLVVHPTKYSSNTIDFFEGLSNEKLNLLKEKVEFSCLTSQKKDVLSIKEYISPIDDTLPGSILIKNFNVVENYKQITSDKVIINGYICVNILYYNKSPINDSTVVSNLHQVQEKVEFTQFVPVKSSYSLDHCKVHFDSSNLDIKIVQHEDGQEILILEGDLITYVQLFKKVQRDMVVDGYHSDKTFIFDFHKTTCCTFAGSINGESSVREIFVPSGIACDVVDILFTSGSIEKYDCKWDSGKLHYEGTILAKIICTVTDETNSIFTINQSIPFKLTSNIDNTTGTDEFCHNLMLKDFWAEKINGKQIEFNATIINQSVAIKMSSFNILSNPAFEITSASDSISPMVIYSCRKGDNLWNVAKKFKTNADNIKEINHLDSEALYEGKKLLVIK